MLDVINRLQKRAQLSKTLNKYKQKGQAVAQGVAFIALGKSEKNFVIKIGKDVVVEGHRGVHGGTSQNIQKNAGIVVSRWIESL